MRPVVCGGGARRRCGREKIWPAPSHRGRRRSTPISRYGRATVCRRLQQPGGSGGSQPLDSLDRGRPRCIAMRAFNNPEAVHDSPSHRRRSPSGSGRLDGNRGLTRRWCHHRAHPPTRRGCSSWHATARSPRSTASSISRRRSTRSTAHPQHKREIAAALFDRLGPTRYVASGSALRSSR